MAKATPRLFVPGKSPEAWDGYSFLDHTSDDEKSKMIQHIKDCYTQSRDWRVPYRDKWLRMYQLYRGFSPFYEEKPDWQANYFVQKAFEFIETVLPRIMSSLYDVPPLFTAIPASQSMVKPARLAELLLQKRTEQTEQYQIDYDAFKEMLIYGTAFEKAGYAIKSGYSGSEWYNADLFDIYPDPYHKKIEDMRYLIERGVKHEEELRHYQDLGLYRDVDKYLSENESESSSRNYFNAMDREKTIGMSGSDDTNMKGYHEVQEFWGKYRIGDGLYDVVAVLIDRKQLLRWDVNPYYFENKKEGLWYAEKPYIKLVNVSMPHEVYGVGELEVIEGMILELNDRRNTYMDGLQYMMSPVFQVVRNLLTNRDQEIVFAPGSQVEVESPVYDAVKPLQMHSGFLHGMTDVENIKQEMRDALGLHQSITGAEGNIRQTATEKVLNLQEANQRIKQKIQINDIGPLRKKARITYLLEKQFTDEDVMAQIFDNGTVQAWANINPAELEFEGEFKLQVGSLYGMKGMRAQQLMQFYEVLKGTPPEQRGSVDMSKLIFMIAAALDISEEDISLTPSQGGAPGMNPMLQPQPQQPPNLSVLPGGMQPQPQAMPGQAQMPADMIQKLLSQVSMSAG